LGFYQGELEFHDLVKNLDKMEKQKQFMSSPAFGCAYVGGEGSAKSSGLMATCILNAADDPGGMSLVGRLNMAALETTTLQTFLELVPADWGTWAEAKKIWTFENGHQVLFRHLDITDPKVHGHIKSLNLSKAYVDEAAEVDEKVILLLIGRLRRKTKSRRILRLGSNPAGHDYMWRMFFDPNRKADWKRLYHGINASSMENVFLPEEYLANRLATYPPDWAERFIYGYFTDFTDLVYKEFTEPTHVYDDAKDWEIFSGGHLPPSDWPVIVGMDIGSGSEGDPWALPVISVAPDGRLYQFAEVYGVDLRIAPIAAELSGYLSGRTLEGLAYDYAQRAAAQELDEHGIIGTPAMKERRPGLFKTEQYMHVDTRLVHPFNDKIEGSPRYFVAKSCVNTFREISGYKWPKDRGGAPKNDFSTNHENSHMPDGIRYAIHTFRPLPLETKSPEKWQNPKLDYASKMFWFRKHEAEKNEGRPENPLHSPFIGPQRAFLLNRRKRDDSRKPSPYN
jgi:Phage terminase large subunit